MRIAIPVAGGRLAEHFGHCERFALIDVTDEGDAILGEEMLDSPAHQPGLLPIWLARHGADLVIVGGVGSRALSLFEQNGIRVITGAPALPPIELVGDYLAGKLESGGNACDH